jgi:hypothetical protein
MAICLFFSDFYMFRNGARNDKRRGLETVGHSLSAQEWLCLLSLSLLVHNRWSVKLLLALTSTVILAFTSCWDPWPYFSFQDFYMFWNGASPSVRRGFWLLLTNSRHITSNGPCRKHCFQQFFCCCMCVPCRRHMFWLRGNLFTGHCLGLDDFSC